MTDEERRNRNPKPEVLVSNLSDHPQIRPSQLELNHVYVLQGPRYATSLNYIGVVHTIDPRTLDALVVHHFHGPRVNLKRIPGRHARRRRTAGSDGQYDHSSEVHGAGSMNSPAVHFDWWLLDHVERCAAWIQTWTGWDCLQQSRACYAIASLAELLQVVTVLRWGFFAPFALLSLALSGWYAFLAMDAHGDDWIRRIVDAGYPNPRKMSDFALLRVLLAVAFLLSFLPLTSWLARLFLAAVLAASYVSACDPLPPSKGKVRDWWANLGKLPMPVTN